MERSTCQRAAIRAVMEAAGRPLTSHEMFDAARARVPRLAMTTVHRSLKAMLVAAEIVTVSLPRESRRYELACRRVRHHFKCEACGKVFGVDGCQEELAALAPAAFTVERHSLISYGSCDDCIATRGE